MAKIYGLFGSMTGKLADTVMVVRNGEQIARKYQPVVTNPKSAKQVSNRAKMKLLSQLSAALAPAIAFPRLGMMSPRNRFTKRNYSIILETGESGSYTERIELQDIVLTDGVRELCVDIDLTLQSNALKMTLVGASTGFDAVEYHVFRYSGGTLAFMGSDIALSNVNDWQGSVNIPDTPGEKYIIYAYGVTFASSSVRSAYSQLATGSSAEAHLQGVRAVGDGVASYTVSHAVNYTVS